MLARESNSAAGNKTSRAADFVRMWRRPQDGEGATVSKDSQRLPWSQGRLGLLGMYSIEPQPAATHSRFFVSATFPSYGRSPTSRGDHFCQEARRSTA